MMAVADYRPIRSKNEKINKNQNIMNIKLKRTPDILAKEFRYDCRRSSGHSESKF